MNTVLFDKLLQEIRQLSPAEQIRLMSVLCEELRAHFIPQIVSLEGRWEDLPFDEEDMERALQELHHRSWRHLEEEFCE
jgi:hypothetical protein